MDNRPRARTTVNLTLSVTPEVAARLRGLASGSGYTVSEYLSEMIEPHVGVSPEQVAAVESLLPGATRSRVEAIAAALGRGEPPFPRPAAGEAALALVSAQLASITATLRGVFEIDGGGTHEQAAMALENIIATKGLVTIAAGELVEVYRAAQSSLLAIMDERRKTEGDFRAAIAREEASAVTNPDKDAVTWATPG